MLAIKHSIKYILLIQIIASISFGFENKICIKKQPDCKLNKNLFDLSKNACKKTICSGKYNHECGMYCSINKEECKMLRNYISKLSRSLISPIFNRGGFKNHKKKLSLIKTCTSSKLKSSDVPLENDQGYQSSHNRYQQQSNQGYDQSRFRYVTNNQQNPPQPANLFTELVSSNQLPPQSQLNVIDPENITSDQEFLNYVTNDFKIWLNSSSWKLSCYSYNRIAPCLPILPDVSPEEVRHSVYDAKKHNHHYEEVFQEHISTLKLLEERYFNLFKYQNFQKKYNDATEHLRQLANPNQKVKEYLLKYFHETKNLSSQPKDLPQQQQSPNLFMQIVQNKQQSTQLFPSQSNFPTEQINKPFSSQMNLPVQNFLQNQQPTQIQTSGSILFTGKTQPNLFSQIIGSSSQTMNTPVVNLSTLQPSSTFSQPSFNSASVSSQPILAKLNLASPVTFDQPNNIYSTVSDLTDQDMKEFQAGSFTLGRLPHNPPIKEACFL